MFTNCRYISTYPAEGLCSSHTTETTRYFLFDFIHSQIPLRKVVIKWDPEIIHKCQHFSFIFTESIQQITSRMLLQFPSLPLTPLRWRPGRVRPVTGTDQSAITVSVFLQGCPGKFIAICLFSGIDSFFDPAKQLDHASGPRLFVMLLNKNQLPEMMGITKSMETIKIKIGFPSIVDNSPQIFKEHSTSLDRFASPLFMAKVVGIPIVSTAVSPKTFAVHVHSGFIKMHRRALAKSIFNSFFGCPKIAIRQLQRVVKRSYAQLYAEYVIEQFNTTFLWQQLIGAQISLECPDSRSVLNWCIDTDGKRCRMNSSALAFKPLSAVLGVFKLLWKRNISTLSFFIIKAFAVSDISTASTLSRDRIENAFIRFLHLPQSKSFVPRLTAAFSFSFFTQTFRCRTFEITRRRLTAVMAVFIDYSLEMGDFLLKRIKPINKHGDQAYNSVFPLPVDCSNIIFGHLNRHIRKLLSGTSACLVLCVKLLCSKKWLHQMW